MINKKELCAFLVKAKKWTYASWNDKISIKEKDFSTTLVYDEWNYKYNDNYFGWEPYWGREVVFFKNKPIYIMTYYGFVEKNVENLWEVYKFLQESLALIPEDKPFRWPKKYKKNNFKYENIFFWEIDNFNWTEKIFLDWKKIYEASYMWGYVDL